MLGRFLGHERKPSIGCGQFVQIDNQPIIIVAHQKDNTENLWDLVVKPFRPFSLELWALVAAVVTAVSFAMMLFEYGTDLCDLALVGETWPDDAWET